MLRSKLVLLAASLALAVPPSAAVAQGGGPIPVINSASVTPVSLTHLGGDVLIRADITDDVGISFAFVEVRDQNGGHIEYAMNFAESSTYEAVVTLDPNHSADPFGYTFTVFARDIDNNAEVSAPAGEVELAGEPPFDEPPSVSAASVSPTSLPAGGGSIVIRATATDNLGITESFATIDLPGGGTAVVALEPVSFTEFEGTYVVPANNLAGSLRYPVHVTVLDEAGGSDSADPGAVTVAGRGGKASKLKSNHKQLDFGAVRVGRTRQMRVEIKHEGDKRAAPIPLTLRTSGAPFQIFTERLVLAPGKKAVILVQFAPTAPGRATGSLIIERGDGGPPLEVALRGKGK